MSPSWPQWGTILVGYTTENEPVGAPKLADAMQDMREWMILKLTSGACSHALISQLAHHYCRIPQRFGDEWLLVDVHAVLDQIGCLEQAPRTRAVGTKPPEQFSDGLLAGLWHKHWFQAGFLQHNLRREAEYEKMRDRLWYGRFEQRRKQDPALGNETDVAKLAGQIAHVFTIDALKQRLGRDKQTTKSRLTGQWIIYGRPEKRNIYLTLATHTESQEDIITRCAPALTEFPDLKTISAFSDR